MNTSAIQVYSDIDAHIEDIVDQEHALNNALNTEKRATQLELNRLARDKAVHIRLKKLEYIKEYKERGETRNKAAAAWKDWCKDVAGVDHVMAHYSFAAGELLVHQEFLGESNLGVRTLSTIAEKKLNKTQMTALAQYLRTQDKPVSRQKIHSWAHRECGKPMPESAKKRENIFFDAPTEAQSMSGRLKLGYSGRTLLGLGMSTPVDVVEIVCKVWAQRYHPDKGASVEDTQRVQEAITVARSTKQ